MRRIIITSYHEVADDVADELVETIKRTGHQLDAIVRLMQEHPPETLGYQIGGVKPPAVDSPDPDR